MLLASLFTIAKKEYHSTDGQINKIWYTYITVFYSAVKKNKTMKFSGTMNETRK